MRRRKKTLVVVVIRRLLTCAICIIALLGFLTVHIYVAPLNRLPRLHLSKYTTRVRNLSLFSHEYFLKEKKIDRFCFEARIVFNLNLFSGFDSLFSSEDTSVTKTPLQNRARL